VLVAHLGGPENLSPLTSWTFDPLAAVALLAVAVGYYRRVQTLARRGTPVSTWRLVAFASGLFTLVVALFSPLDPIGEQEFFFVHMAQHILIGEVAPILIVAGLTGPILRPVLQYRVVQHLRVLAHPLVALPIWAVTLYAWHLPFMYEAALHHDVVHALEHASFLTAGVLFWAPVLEPLPAPAWFGSGAKLLYIVVARFTSMILANVLLWSNGPSYETYRHSVERWGISAAGDQGIAGGLMMIVDSVITIAAIAWLFLKLAGESERRQELIESGMEPEAAARAVRYGRS
jgi:cytochrome c oxidase assembly factor CtaG